MTGELIPVDGRVYPNPARLNGRDLDRTPVVWRRYVNASGAREVQLLNGLRDGIARGVRLNPTPGGLPAYLQGQTPRTPGLQRGDAGGFHSRAPAQAQIQAMYQSGPGSQPDSVGGPGSIAGNMLFNPMSG